ncbi:hypothetical protein [Pseudoalteromonas sp. GB56]
MADSSDVRLAKLYQSLVSVIVISVLLGSLLYYSLGLSSSVDEVVKDKALDEFQRTSMQVHAKWLAKKQRKITLTKVDDSLKKIGAVDFVVNSAGWPVEVISETEQERCASLFFHLQGKQRWPAFSAQQVHHDGIVKECAYYLNDVLWFTFDLQTGTLSINNN